MGRHQLAVSWRRGCWGLGQFSLLLGQEMEEDTQLLAPEAVGPLATPLLLFGSRFSGGGRRHQNPQGEVKGCVESVDGWESGDLVGPVFALQAGVFPFGCWFSDL